MFALVVSTLLGFQSLSCDANIAADRRAADNIINIQSVQVIKENLRKNNDDYKDDTWNANLLDAPERSSRAPDAAAGAHRRANGAPSGERAPGPSEPTRRHPKYIHTSTAAALGDYQGDNSLPEAAAAAGAAAAVGATAGPRMRAAVLASHPPRHRHAGAVAAAATADPARLPSGLELDMSPARGAKVHEMRSKNRLCQRHVVVPEGPKYDSKGKVYLRAYETLHGRDYSATRPPHLLLPKCCNCCKKSVLGCE